MKTLPPKRPRDGFRDSLFGLIAVRAGPAALLAPFGQPAGSPPPQRPSVSHRKGSRLAVFRLTSRSGE